MTGGEIRENTRAGIPADKKNEERIHQLQENIESLRLSRRILMALLESMQGEYKEENQRLTDDNKRLKRNNHNFVNRLWEKNRRIRELEIELDRFKAKQ